MALRVTDSEFETLLARTGKAGSVTPTILPATKSKYNASRTVADGYTFASKGEAQRYSQLVMQQHADLISELRCQVRYRLVVKRETVCYYVADFSYRENGRRIIEDYKGVRLPTYRLKKKLLWAISGIVIRESTRKDL
jgi:dsDNA-binding SOS-regulon protein